MCLLHTDHKISSRWQIMFIVAAAILTLTRPVLSEETPATVSSHLFGDLGGARSSLEEHGVTVESTLINDLMANVSGGVNRSAVVLGNYDLTLTFDTTKGALWEGGTFVTYLVGTYGDAPHKSVGDYQYTDNIDVYSTVTLYQFYYEQSFFNKRLSLLVGLHDYNIEFYDLQYGLDLINSSFGIGAEAYQVVPPIFNLTSVGVRAKVRPTNDGYIMSGLYDGVPGDPNNPNGTHIRFDKGDGVFWTSEAGVQRAEDDTSSRYYKAGIGLWYHTKDFIDFNGESRSKNHGIYLLGEAMLIPEEAGFDEGLGAFATFGTAEPSVNQVGRSIVAGLHYTGLFPGRSEDILAVGYARAENGNQFMEANAGVHRAETALELTYLAQVLPYLQIQPDLQYVMNPSMSRDIGDAWVLGLRVTVDL
ncbi:MAG: carbohydrate porin [Proteobacteria bacterium]|nr:carbohydrate porin [Pseudomonadota bacterium]